MQLRNIIETLGEIPQWTEGNDASFLDDAIDLSLQSINDNSLYEKCEVSLGK